MNFQRLALLLVPAIPLSLAALWLFGLVVERSVVRDAERQSLAWAEYAAQRITRIEELAEGAAPTQADLHAVADMENFGHVFRFKLFGPDGTLRFVSEDPLAAGPDLGDHNPTAAAVVETLAPYTVVEDGTEKPDRPDLYSETYFPVVKDERVVAIVETYLDQTETRAAIRRDYAAFGLAIVSLIALGLAGPIVALIIVLRRLRQQNFLLAAERERAVAADRTKSEFLANVSHELRTPLNGIIGMAELMEDQELDEEGREMLDVMRSSSTELMILVSSLLDMTRIESGEMRLDKAPFDPAAILGDVAALLGPDARRKGLSLDLDLPPPDAPQVLGDQHAFRQTCLNLLGNALKFTEEGQVRVSLGLDQQDDITMLTLTVADTGIGIAQDDLEGIFERFVRTRHGLNIGASGTGLGLPIARAVVEMMGGSIAVDSTPGEGSVFTARFPVGVADKRSERLAA